MEYSLATLMLNIVNDEKLNMEKTILHHKEGVNLIPANIELSAIEVSLVNAMSRELILKSMVEKLRDFYDFIIIDCMGEHCKTVLCLLYKRTILVFSSFFIFLLFSYGA